MEVCVEVFRLCLVCFVMFGWVVGLKLGQVGSGKSFESFDLLLREGFILWVGNVCGEYFCQCFISFRKWVYEIWG